MEKITIRQPIILYMSNLDLKILEQNAAAWGMTLHKAISSILQQWVNEHVGSRTDSP